MGFFDYAAQHIIDFLDVFRRYRVDELVCVVVHFIAAFRENQFVCALASLRAKLGSFTLPSLPEGEGIPRS